MPNNNNNNFIRIYFIRCQICHRKWSKSCHDNRVDITFYSILILILLHLTSCKTIPLVSNKTSSPADLLSHPAAGAAGADGRHLPQPADKTHWDPVLHMQQLQQPSQHSNFPNQLLYPVWSLLLIQSQLFH